MSTTDQPNPKVVAYEAFSDQIDHNLESSGATQAVEEAFRVGDLDGLMLAVRDMCRDAAGKAAMLWVGSPVGTILRNVKTSASAQRAIGVDGIPLWQVSDNDGNRWDSHEPVLQPEGDWKCIYDPRLEEVANDVPPVDVSPLDGKA